MPLNKTSIEWVKNPDGSQGYTWNPITGCLNQNNGLCKGGGFPCYAYRLAHGRLRQRYLANSNLAPFLADVGYGAWAMGEPFYPRFWLERLEQATKQFKMPRGIFVCDMGELFSDWLPEVWIKAVFQIIKWHPQSRFYLLTKQPQNLLRWSPFPDNCWVGVTVTRPEFFRAAYEALDCIIAKVKFISIEPFLELMGKDFLELVGQPYYRWLDWLIIGAQTKPYKPPKIEWVQEIVEACDKASIPVFQKDNLKTLLGDNLRQELIE